MVSIEGLSERLLRRRTISAVGCWEWKGSLDHGGYGKIALRSEGKSLLRGVHRVAAAIWMGFELESELQICHHCDNRKCFNPEHLFIGTQKDNVRDALTKGRLDPGRPGKSKTHCPAGHPYSGTNLIMIFRKKGGTNRQCRACRNPKGKKYQANRRMELKKRGAQCA